MTSATDELSEIAEQLKEARRYVRSDMAHVRDVLRKCYRRVQDWQSVSGCHGSGDLFARITRIMENISVGLEYIQVSPCVLEGYIDGAVFELGLKGGARE